MHLHTEGASSGSIPKVKKIALIDDCKNITYSEN